MYTRKRLLVACLAFVGMVAVPVSAQNESGYRLTKIADIDTVIPGIDPVRRLHPNELSAPPCLSAGGYVAFLGTVRENAQKESPDGTRLSHPYTDVGNGIFLANVRKPDTVVTIALSGATAPGGGTFNALVAPFLGTTAGGVGFLAFFSSVTPSASQPPDPATVDALHLFVYDLATQKLRLALKSPLSTPQGFTLDGTGAINSAGQIVFGTLNTKKTAGGYCLFPATGTDRDITTITPGMPDGSDKPYPRLTNPQIGERGEVALGGLIEHNKPGVNYGLYLVNKAGKFAPIFEQGDPSPTGKWFMRMTSQSAAVNSTSNLVAFASSTEAFDGAFVYNMQTRRTDLVAVVNGDAPNGLGKYSQIIYDIGVNSRGEVAFVASLNPPPDAGAIGLHALFTQNARGVTRLVARTGDSFDGSTLMGFATDARCIDDTGGIAFRYVLADGRAGYAYARP